MAERICVMCNQNKAGGDGLCVKCRFQLNTKYSELCQDTEILLPEGRYYGKTRNGIPNGRGELVYQECDERVSYLGEFKDGMRHGRGELAYRSGAVYKGDWICDKQEGYGEETLPGGTSIEGYYESGELIRGHIYFGDGREYEGEWKDDQPNGNGRMYFRDGHAEEGFWVDGVCAFAGTPSEEELLRYGEASAKDGAEQELKSFSEPIEEDVQETAEESVAEENDSEEAAACIPVQVWKPFDNLSEEKDKPEEAVEGFVEENAEIFFGETKEEDNPLTMGEEDYPGGEHYSGQFLDGKRHGFGTMTYPNGDIYEGEYKNGKREGQGQMTYANGNVYDGQWVNSKKSGQGILVLANDDRYEGEFSMGAFGGCGTYYFANGNSYSGMWMANNRNGMGIMTYADGVQEEQIWEDGKKISAVPIEGMDMPLNPEPQAASPVVPEEKVAEGVLEEAAGEITEEVINEAEESEETAEIAEIAESAGTADTAESPEIPAAPERVYRSLHYKSGNNYEGEVNERNQPDGIGVFTYANGCLYEGGFREGMRDGFGVFTWNTGDVYEGEWHQDLRHGQGKMTYASGRVQEGLFENNKFIG